MTADARHLVVGRLRKPHGLKGDLTLFPITDDPETVFAPGRSVWLVGLDGETVAGPVMIERSRSYHREWLVKFAGADGREAIDPWRGLFLAVPADELTPPEGDEVYLHELDGFAVRLPDETPLGLVSAVYELPAGLMIEVQGPRREFLLPYKKEFVRQVDRAGRKLVVTLPEGLIEESGVRRSDGLGEPTRCHPERSEGSCQAEFELRVSRSLAALGMTAPARTARC